MKDRKFDIALSFSGKNREVAHNLAKAIQSKGLTIFYDEWFKADIWGEELTQLLPQIYLNARICVPIISADYIKGPYTKREFQAILENELNADNVILLPIRLDDTKVPGLSEAKASLNYHDESLDEIANFLKKRIAETPVCQSPSVADKKAEPLTDFSQHKLTHYFRDFPDRSIVISNKDIVELLRKGLEATFSEQRIATALELVHFLNIQEKLSLGTPYDIWCSEQVIFLSCLPDICVSHGAKNNNQHITLEFHERGRTEFMLHSIWKTEDPRYSCVPHNDLQPAIKGLTANRVVPSLYREVVIRILESRKADFGFPLTSGEHKPNKLCGWIQEQPPNDFMEWGRDPRLIAGKLSPTYHIYDTDVDVAILVTDIQGAWSSHGFNALIAALARHLPNRYQLAVIEHGIVRLNVYLGANDDLDNLMRSYDLIFAAFARMEAAVQGWPVQVLSTDNSLATLSEELSCRFKDACSAIGKETHIELTDSAKPLAKRTRLRKLRQAHYHHGSRFDPKRYYEFEASFATHNELIDFVTKMETKM